MPNLIRRSDLRALVLASVAALLLGGCAFRNGHQVEAVGTVIYLPLEGGFFGIIDDEGHHWDPSNLPARFQTDGLRVDFRGDITDKPTPHMWGRTVYLTSIRLR